MVTAKANIHDSRLALPTIDGIMIGNRKRKPKRVRADKGYDSRSLRQQLRQRSIKPALDAREYPVRLKPAEDWDDRKEIRYAPNRWKVEQRFACLDQSRRLNFLFERTRKQYEAFLTLAFIRCYLKILAKTRKRKRGVWR